MANPLLAPKGYKALLKKRQKSITPVQTDPFAATSPASINQTVNKYVGMYGTPQTDAQIQAGAQAQVDPIVAALTKQINDRAASSSRSITGNANSLASSLGKIDYGAPYASATHDQAAVNAALQQSLTGGGNTLAADLQNRLGVIDDPTVRAAGGTLSAYGAGTGTTQLADGSANLGALLAEAAAAKTYGLKQPGLARMQGLQDVAGVNQEAVHDIGAGTTDVLKQLPQIVQAARSNNQDLRANRAGSAAQIYETLSGQNVTKATAKAGLQNTAFDNGLAYANTFGTDPSTGQVVAGYHKDKSGNIVKNSTTTKPKLSPADTQKYKGVALTIAQQGLTGAPEVVDPNTGKVTDPALPKLTYKQAILEMEKEGVPEAIAVATANRVYGSPMSRLKTSMAVKSGLGIPKTTGPFAGLTGGQ